MDKDLYKENIILNEKIKSLKETLVKEIEDSKPSLELGFLTTKELVDNTDPAIAKVTQDKIKKELKELNRLINILWQ